MLRLFAHLLLLASVIAASTSGQSFNAVIDKLIADGIKTIKKSMEADYDDSTGSDVIQDVRIQARQELINLLAQQTGRQHYQIYKSFADQLDDETDDYYYTKFGTLFLIYPMAPISRDKEPIKRTALNAYSLLIWAANMKRRSDDALLEVIKLMFKFVEEMAQVKWKSGSEEKDFISVTLPRLRALEKTLEQGVSFESSLKAIPIK